VCSQTVIATFVAGAGLRLRQTQTAAASNKLTLNSNAPLSIYKN
jgi:hypothetical protein